MSYCRKRTSCWTRNSDQNVSPLQSGTSVWLTSWRFDGQAIRLATEESYTIEGAWWSVYENDHHRMEHWQSFFLGVSQRRPQRQEDRTAGEENRGSLPVNSERTVKITERKQELGGTAGPARSCTVGVARTTDAEEKVKQGQGQRQEEQEVLQPVSGSLHSKHSWTCHAANDRSSQQRSTPSRESAMHSSPTLALVLPARGHTSASAVS